MINGVRFRAAPALVVVAAAILSAGCSSGSAGSSGAGAEASAAVPSNTPSSAPPTLPAPTSASTPSASPTSTFDVAAVKDALLKPADLGSGWNAQTDKAVVGATAYGWGCPSTIVPHPLGDTPTALSAAKWGGWDAPGGAQFFFERAIVFTDAASAAAAQHVLESASTPCVGTHHIAATSNAVGATDTDGFTVQQADGFTGKILHRIDVKDGARGVNELLNVETRSGNVLVVFSYTMFHDGTDKPSYRSAFKDQAEKLLSEALTRLASAGN